MLQQVSLLLSSRGRFSPSELKAHNSGAKLSFCHTTACLWHVPAPGQVIFSLQTQRALGFTESIPVASLLSQQV